jgi:hypothetical protein
MPAPNITFSEPQDPFNAPSQELRSSASLTMSDTSARPVSAVSFPERTYQPATLSVSDLAKCPPRSAGQAPPLSKKKLEQFPLPKSGSAHLHPNTLFTQLADELPPSPPATVTKQGAYFTGTTGAKTPVAKIRQLFDHEKAEPMPTALHAAKPSIAASSFYSCDEQGNRVEEAEEEKEGEEEVALPPSASVVTMPGYPAPGGADWV